MTPPEPFATADDDAAVRASASVQRVVTALHELLVDRDVTVLTGSARTAAEAADQLGVEVGQIANSLVFALREEPGSEPVPVLVLTSGAHRVDTVKVADVLEVAALERADPATVREATGFAIGGVAPVGHLHPMRTFVDIALSRWPTVWAAAGHPRAVFATSYDELLRLTGGQSVEVV